MVRAIAFRSSTARVILILNRKQFDLVKKPFPMELKVFKIKIIN